jgi:pilus assembly protein CpaE
MAQTSGTRSLNLTFVTVCLQPEAAGAARDAAGHAGWALQEIHFEAYISAKRRPYFGSHLQGGDGCVALVDFDQDPQAAAEATMFLHQVFAGQLVVIAISTDGSPDSILLAMRAGCTEFLLKPLTESNLDEAFARVEEHIASNNAAGHKAGSVLAFFGAKGGVGTTTLALHLATFLVQQNAKRILLIDNHAQFGHACIYLGLEGSEIHFQELVRNVGRLDSELLRGFLGHHPSGLDVLSSPDVGKQARPMHPDDVAGTLEFLRGEYDFILVDCAATLDDVNRAVVQAATQVYVVATPEISAIRDLSRYVDDLVGLSDVKDKVRIILNRYSSQFAISLDVVEKAVRLPISYCIPNNFVELVRSANLGAPVATDRSSAFAQDIRSWANALVGLKQVLPDEARTGQESRPQPNAWESIKGGLSVLLGPSIATHKRRA